MPRQHGLALQGRHSEKLPKNLRNDLTGRETVRKLSSRLKHSFERQTDQRSPSGLPPRIPGCASEQQPRVAALFDNGIEDAASAGQPRRLVDLVGPINLAIPAIWTDPVSRDRDVLFQLAKGLLPMPALHDRHPLSLHCGGGCQSSTESLILAQDERWRHA